MRMANEFSIGEALSNGWHFMKKNFLLFFYIILTLIAVELIIAIGKRIGAVGILLVIACFVVMMILKLGVIRIALDTVDKKKVDYRQLFSQPNLFPDYLIGTVLYILIVIGGLILLIVPGIIWAIKFQFYDYYIVDKKMGPFDALKRSAKATYGYKWSLFLFALAIIGINIVGALCLLVGLFATIPTAMIAETWTYRVINDKYEARAKAQQRAEKISPKQSKTVKK
jgi:uncharacterized membrane protein